MIELILSALGYLAKAVSKSRMRPREMFESHVVPLHHELLEVQQDYTRCFNQLDDMLGDHALPMEALVSHIERRRRELRPIRQSAAEFGEALAQLFEVRSGGKSPRADSMEWLLHQYADAILDYLYGGVDPEELKGGGAHAPELSVRTRYTELLEALENKEHDSPRAHAAALITRAYTDLEDGWGVLARRYNALRVRCVVRP